MLVLLYVVIFEKDESYKSAGYPLEHYLTQTSDLIAARVLMANIIRYIHRPETPTYDIMEKVLISMKMNLWLRKMANLIQVVS